MHFVKSERKSKLQLSILASLWSPDVCGRHNRRVRHVTVGLSWSFISHRLLWGILCTEINCSNDICTIITQLIHVGLWVQYEALNWNVMKTYTYTSHTWACKRGGGGDSALKLLIYNVMSDYMSNIIREGSDSWYPQLWKWFMLVSSMVYNMMCWNSEANVTVIELKSRRGLQNVILHSCAWRAWYYMPIKGDFALES